MDHNKLWKILKEIGIPDHLTCLLRNLYAGQEATVRTGHGTTDWFQIGKGVSQGCILSPCLFNLYAEYVMTNLDSVLKSRDIILLMKVCCCSCDFIGIDIWLVKEDDKFLIIAFADNILIMKLIKISRNLRYVSYFVLGQNVIELYIFFALSDE